MAQEYRPKKKSKSRMPRQSQFHPTRPEKYCGKLNCIVARSGLERSIFKYLDTNSAVKKWSSEEHIVRYWSPVDHNEHRYFIDLYVELVDGTKLLVEVKPQSQTMHPTLPKRTTQIALERYTNELKTFSINKAKWAAAEKYARMIGARFVVWSESSMLRMGVPGFKKL